MSKSRAQRFRRGQAPGQGDAAPVSVTPSIAALLGQANIWSDWLEEAEIGAIGWTRLAALMLRELTADRAIAVLAPALLAAADAADAMFAGDMPDDDQPPIGFEDWLSAWHEASGEIIDDALGGLTGSPDIDWFAGQCGVAIANPQALLWFLLGGIYHASEDLRSSPEAQGAHGWLVGLAEPTRRSSDLLAGVLGHFYDRFRDGCPSETSPLPEQLIVDHDRAPFDDDSTQPPRGLTGMLYEAREPLTGIGDLLGQSSLNWAANAATLTGARGAGLIERGGTAITPAGREALAKNEHDRGPD